MTTSPFRTGSTVRWEIEIFDNGTWSTEKLRIEGMDGIRHLCADLVEGIDQAKDSLYNGEDGMDHTSIFVEPASVGEAVRRINECGFATDEDESEEEELEEGVDYPVDELIEGIDY